MKTVRLVKMLDIFTSKIRWHLAADDQEVVFCTGRHFRSLVDVPDEALVLWLTMRRSPPKDMSNTLRGRVHDYACIIIDREHHRVYSGAATLFARMLSANEPLPSRPIYLSFEWE